MRLSTDITLPRKYKPKFPDKCVVCCGVPDSTAKIAHSSHSPFVAIVFPIICLFGWSRIEFPICRSCKPRFRFQRWGRELTAWLLIIAGICFIAPHFENLPRTTRKFVIIGLVLLVVSPHYISEVLWARFFTTTAEKDAITYEFASLPYAAEFHELNEPFVIKSDFKE